MRHWSLLAATLVITPAFALDGSAGVKSTPLLKATHSWDGTPLVYPAGQAEASVLLIEIAPGQETGWHSHPVPSFAYVLQGELEVTLEDGRSHRLKAGEALAEVVNKKHNGRNVGTDVLKLAVVYAGASGTALTQKP